MKLSSKLKISIQLFAAMFLPVLFLSYFGTGGIELSFELVMFFLVAALAAGYLKNRKSN